MTATDDKTDHKQPGDHVDLGGLEHVGRVAARIQSVIETVIAGKPEVIRAALTVLLAGGHLLLEDVPGVGKTMLSKALARSIDGSVRRIQFTPDLLPSDVTGVSIFNQETREFEFRRGAVFGNIVVGDEINRASPKTQSALLECMEEQQVTVDNHTYRLDNPFMVIATQNPIEMEGTYPLPEAQRDRFMARIAIGYPSESAEIAMLDGNDRYDPLADLTSVSDAAEVSQMVAETRRVFVSPSVLHYAVSLVSQTRSDPHLRLGASPRATLHLIRAAKAAAALDQREYVLPDDLQDLAAPVLCHRLLLSTEALIRGMTAEHIISSVVARTPLPAPGRPSPAS